MPELPDVEVYKRYLDRTALHKKVDSARIFDDKVVKDVTARTLQRRVKNRTFASSRRRGKHLFVGLGADEGWLGMHFGMTGYLHYYKEEPDTPEYTRVRFRLANGYHLAYVCRRNLGALRIINNLEAFIAEKELGPDARETDAEGFIERLGGRRGSIKTALMNQSAVAGIGNVYSDEILFQARIHPEQAIPNLHPSVLHDLFDALQRVLDDAIAASANPDEMPRDFLLPRRSDGSDCPRCGGAVKKITVGGRPTYYCPACQKKR